VGTKARAAAPSDTAAMAVLSVAFFASGFAALLCQIVWQRMLGIFAGSDTVSASIVVGAFLAGLGIGSIIGARIADRLSPARAIAGFVIAEVGVAAFALLSKGFLYDLLATRLAGVVDDPTAIFALCFAGLVLPTTLMGLSLPLLSRAIATTVGDLAERIGTLYGLNTLGAGLGALIGGGVLVGSLGYVGALYVAAGLDLAAALLALALLRGAASAGAQAPAAPADPMPAAPHAGGAAPYGGLALWCLLVFVSGYVIVSLEIVWVRVLGQIGMFHAYLFPLVLGVSCWPTGSGSRSPRGGCAACAIRGPRSSSRRVAASCSPPRCSPPRGGRSPSRPWWACSASTWTGSSATRCWRWCRSWPRWSDPLRS
jgi:MFS family permease